MSEPRVDILIPTMDNRQYLEPCLRSIRRWTRGIAYRVIVINNGMPASLGWIDQPNVAVIQAGGNRGWIGGIEIGLRHSDAKFVCFLNDDTLIVPSSPDWLATLVGRLGMRGFGAAGPSSNCVSGPQSIWDVNALECFPAQYLIGFCMVLSREALERAGGVDTALPGGDDLDLSIRLQDAGYSLVADRTVYVHHVGFVTGTRIYGPAQWPGGWNSPQYGQAVVDALIVKHGRDRLQRIGWVV